jgi:hypothetical protein
MTEVYIVTENWTDYDGWPKSHPRRLGVTASLEGAQALMDDHDFTRISYRGEYSLEGQRKTAYYNRRIEKVEVTP